LGRNLFLVSPVGGNGVCSVFGLIRGFEWVLWLVITVFAAVTIAKKALSKYFLHGFLLGLIGGAVSCLIQGLLFDTYLARNPDFADRMTQMPAGMDARTLVFPLIPIGGLFTGLVLGLFAWIASRITPKAPVPSVPPAV
jgi:Na+/serine symporter